MEDHAKRSLLRYLFLALGLLPLLAALAACALQYTPYCSGRHHQHSIVTWLVLLLGFTPFGTLLGGVMVTGYTAILAGRRQMEVVRAMAALGLTGCWLLLGLQGLLGLGISTIGIGADPVIPYFGGIILVAVCAALWLGICLAALIKLAVRACLRWCWPAKWAAAGTADVASPPTGWFRNRPALRGAVYAAFVTLAILYSLTHRLRAAAAARLEGGTGTALFAAGLGALLFLIGFSRPKWSRLSELAELWPPTMFSLSWITSSAASVFLVWGNRLVTDYTGVQSLPYFYLLAATAVATWVFLSCMAADVLNLPRRPP
jgi:hypothetical protein